MQNQIEEANTNLAQGGIASVTKDTDKFDKHIADTLIAGDGICDESVVRMVVENAPREIDQLVKWGVDFDKDASGNFDLHKEGGHSEFRILHHKDSTGAEIQHSLVKRINQHPNIEVFENHFAIDLITQHHLGQLVKHTTPGIECYGVYVLNPKTRHVHTFLSKVTMMAGGIGRYINYHKSFIATGWNSAIGVKDQKIGVQQFHPTSLYNPNERPFDYRSFGGYVIVILRRRIYTNMISVILSRVICSSFY